MKVAIAAFCTGLIIGSSALVAVTGHDLDLLYFTVRQLKEENKQLTEANQLLEKEVAQKSRQNILRVRKVEVHITGTEDDFVKLAVYKFITQKTKPLLDQEVTWLGRKYELIYELLEQQKVPVNQEMYQIHMKAIAFGEILIIGAEVRKIPSSA